MSTETVDRDRRRWEPIFVNTPVHESATAAAIRTALIETVGQRGSKAVTLEAVIERAGIDRAEFDREYDSLEESYIDAWVYVISDFLRRSEAAFARGGEDWRECLRYQAWDLLRYVEENLNEARFLIEMTFADELVQANRDIAMARMIDYIDLGRYESEDPAAVPRATAEALVGAIWNGLAMNIVEPVNSEVLRSGPQQILYLTMMAYIGEEAAREEMLRAPDDLVRYERGEL
jgi:AcrR family transcriptional regulator